jgi:hypothetical protein
VIVVSDLEQGSPEWFAARAGRATASCFSDVMAKGQGKTRASYLRRVIAERLTGKVAETFKNRDTDRGQEQEPMACLSYEGETDELLQRVGFIQHDTLMAGCSPDRLVVGKRKGVEVKCVLPHVQVETILSGAYPSEHKPQVQGSMWITGFEEWDFCSYSPDMPKHRRLYVYTVKRDEAYIKTLEAEVVRFLAEVDRLVDYLLGKEQDIEALLRKSLEKVAA